jgi:hypothetical protein
LMWANCLPICSQKSNSCGLFIVVFFSEIFPRLTDATRAGFKIV